MKLIFRYFVSSSTTCFSAPPLPLSGVTVIRWWRLCWVLRSQSVGDHVLYWRRGPDNWLRNVIVLLVMAKRNQKKHCNPKLFTVYKLFHAHPGYYSPTTENNDLNSVGAWRVSRQYDVMEDLMLNPSWCHGLWELWWVCVPTVWYFVDQMINQEIN